MFGSKRVDEKMARMEAEEQAAAKSVKALVDAYKSGQHSRKELRAMAESAIYGKKSVMNQDWCHFQYVCIKLGGSASHSNGAVYWVED